MRTRVLDDGKREGRSFLSGPLFKFEMSIDYFMADSFVEFPLTVDSECKRCPIILSKRASSV